MKYAFLILLVISFSLLSIAAEKKNSRKIQEVNFDGSDVDGQSRNPNGSYLLQKRGIDFVPLYKVRESFDDNIKESIEYVK